jgi:hypothetical protein
MQWAAGTPNGRGTDAVDPNGRRPGCRGWIGDAADAALPAETRVAKALTILGPAALAAAAVFAWLPWASWVVFAFGWMLFPVVGLLAGGLADLGRAGLRRVASDEGWLWPGAMPTTSLAEAPRRRTLVALWRIRSAVARTPHSHGRAELDGLVEMSDRLAAAVVRGDLPPALAADAADRLLPAAADAVERFADYAHMLPTGHSAPSSEPAGRTGAD